MAHKILLVDDDPDFTAIHKEILEKDGFQVSVIHNSIEAAEALEAGKESPDLIMCDLMMEKDDSGFKFCHRVRRNPKTATLPILMCTGVARAHHEGFQFAREVASNEGAIFPRAVRVGYAFPLAQVVGLAGCSDVA